MNIEDEFSRGVDDYYSGLVPAGWEDSEAWKNPYLAGWLIASHEDNGIEFFAEDDEEEEEVGDYRVVIETKNEQYEYTVTAESEEDAETEAITLAREHGAKLSDFQGAVYRTTRL